jgi:hypothetical protein
MAMDFLELGGRVLRNVNTGLQRGAGDMRENGKIWQRLILSWCQDPGGLIESLCCWIPTHHLDWQRMRS